MSKYSGVKGMNDVLPPAVDAWHFLERTARETLGNYGYAEIRTPILEDTELFTRSVGEGTDIVGKEMYSFEDKGGRKVAMRPEGTAPAARAYLEHSLHQKEPVTRWYYLGPMFRYERMKTGRYRQFWQLGVEAYGPDAPSQDVEVMELAAHFVQKLGLTDVSLQINSLGDETTRPAYVAKVAEYFKGHQEKLSDEAKQTLATNPMRLLDSKDHDLQPLIAQAPVMLDALDPASKAHFDEVQRLLKLLGIPYEINPRLVRGLDYYTRTAFELVAKSEALGTASTVGGGGRYDRLIEQLGGPKVPAVGWAMGIERLCILLGEKVQAPRPLLFVLAADAPGKDAALKLVTELRHQGLKVDFDPRAGSIKAQFKRVDHVGAQFAIVLGEREAHTGSAKLKRLSDGVEREVLLAELATELKR